MGNSQFIALSYILLIIHIVVGMIPYHMVSYYGILHLGKIVAIASEYGFESLSCLMSSSI